MEELPSQLEPGVTAASVPVSLEACVKGGVAQLSPGTLKLCGKFSLHVPAVLQPQLRRAESLLALSPHLGFCFSWNNP